MQRKNAILLAASDHFGRFGFRGASLRDIARDAGVSLTLLNHHYGCKAGMLDAVLQACRPVLDERCAALRGMTQAGPCTPHDLVAAWIGMGFEMAARPDGERLLRMLARVFDDPREDGVPLVADRLDDATLAFIDALQRCYPTASRQAVTSAYLWVNGSLQKFLTGARRIFELSDRGMQRGDAEVDQARLARFLVAGIDAALREPGPAAEDGSDRETGRPGDIPGRSDADSPADVFSLVETAEQGRCTARSGTSIAE